MNRSRNFVFTINNYSPEEVDIVKGWECKYVKFGKEVAPTTGTPHLQGYVCFENQMTLSALKKKYSIGDNHWEVMRGTPEQNDVYCEKDGDVFEKGTKPLSPAEKGSGEKRRWADAFDAVKEGRLQDVPKDILCSKLKNIQYAVKAVSECGWNRSTIDGALDHEWIVGDTGCGKSRSARERYPDAYVKDPTTPWWDGYDGQEVVIIDDFDKFQVKQGGDMKRWLDRYAFQAQFKGGYLFIRPRKIIVTSQYRPSEIWDDEKTVDAITRRVSILGMRDAFPEWTRAHNETQNPNPLEPGPTIRSLSTERGERSDPRECEGEEEGPRDDVPDPYLDDQAHFDKFGYFLLG